jgi:hypothetical protein
MPGPLKKLPLHEIAQSQPGFYAKGCENCRDLTAMPYWEEFRVHVSGKINEAADRSRPYSSPR